MSQTIIIPNMYQTPAQQFQIQTGQPPPVIDENEAQDHLLDFYEDVCTELSSFGELEELHVCNNLGDHLMGNVYAKYYDEEGAAAAQKALHGRFYAKRALICEFSPVTDFRESRCRQFDQNECTRGGYCNFMHLYKIPYDVERRLFRRKRRSSPPRRERRRRDYNRAPYERSKNYRRYSRSRSPPPRRRDYERRYSPDRYDDRYDDRYSSNHNRYYSPKYSSPKYSSPTERKYSSEHKYTPEKSQEREREQFNAPNE